MNSIPIAAGIGKQQKTQVKAFAIGGAELVSRITQTGIKCPNSHLLLQLTL